MLEPRPEGFAKGCVGEEGGRVGAGRGDSRYVAEALRGTRSSSGHSGWRAKSQGERNGMRLKKKMENKSWEMMLICFKQELN